jgi:predicted flavoprotein YhiN
MQDVHKMKNRDVKRELMEQALECKKKVAQVLEIIRESLTTQMTNLQIAQLNDCAYKAIRKVGVQKKLDERAIKNESYFKVNDKKLENLVAGLNAEKIRVNHQQIINEIGSCPMSLSDTVELMENKDCMCLALQISRSEATI